MSTHLRRQTATFVVRVWLEYLQQEPSCWRGEIVYLPSGERQSFTDLDSLMQVLTAQCRLSVSRPGGKHP